VTKAVKEAVKEGIESGLSEVSVSIGEVQVRLETIEGMVSGSKRATKGERSLGKARSQPTRMVTLIFPRFATSCSGSSTCSRRPKAFRESAGE